MAPSPNHLCCYYYYHHQMPTHPSARRFHTSPALILLAHARKHAGTGNPIISACSSGAYQNETCETSDMSGTSMATPAVAGMVRMYRAVPFDAPARRPRRPCYPLPPNEPSGRPVP